MNNLRIAVFYKKKKKKKKKVYLLKVVVSNMSLLFQRKWIPHMLGAALPKIMYRQPLPYIQHRLQI